MILCVFIFFWNVGSLQTSLLCIEVDLCGGLSVAVSVAVGVFDM